MGKGENKGRWFLITCKCKAIFTINSQRFLQEKLNFELRCPNCSKDLFEDILIKFDFDGAGTIELFKSFLEFYEKLEEKLPLKIREISYEELDAIKNPYKPKKTYHFSFKN